MVRTYSELKRQAREFLVGHYQVPILAMLTASILPAAVLTPFSVGVTYEMNFQLMVYIAAVCIVEVLGQLLIVGASRIHLLLAKKEQVLYTDVFWAFRTCPDRFLLAALLLFGLSLLPVLPVAVCVYALIGMKTAAAYAAVALAALAAGAAEMYLAIVYSLVYPLYIEHPEMTVLDGFHTSRRMMRGNKMRLFLLQLSFIGWRLLGVCSLGIGTLWIHPYISQTLVNFYLDLTGMFDQKAEHIDAAVSD